jgi:tRNA(Ile)-lysidine synthase
MLGELFAPWTSNRHILAAVSGGPDSMALLSMLAQWRQSVPDNRLPKISAATVDHRLRPEAAGEASAVADFVRSLESEGCHIDHTILTWQHHNPTTRLQERARQARYELLTDQAARIGADVVMTAHHADDQAETILFRIIRGSGLAGLAGMSRERSSGPLVLARPLLSIRKDELIGWCRRRGIGWSDDPGNINPRFARSRMRALLPPLEKEGLGPHEWARLARRVGRAEQALDSIARSEADRHFGDMAGDAISLDLRHLLDQPEEIALRVLVIAVERFEPLRPVRLERAEALLDKLVPAARTGQSHRATLGQARIALSPKGILTLTRQAERRRGVTAT